MNSQKYDNMLNLALNSNEGDRAKSEELNTGYSENEKSWEVIVRYVDNIDFLSQYGIEIIYLAMNYAILTVPDSVIGQLSTFEEIIFVEMPKTLYLNAINGIRNSCINEVQTENFRVGRGSGGLFGEGVICAVIDSGIDYSHPAFLTAEGKTRILELWDQSISTGTSPDDYKTGSVYTEEDINRALLANNEAQRYSLVPSRDLSGHGTHVAGIMAGNFARDRNNNLGIATKSQLIVVKLDTRSANGFPTTTQLMMALDYVYKAGIRYRRPVSVNISFGNTYGSHDGTSLLETFIDDISDLWKMSISIGTGNEGSNAGHSLEYFEMGDMRSIEISVGNYENNLNIQIWKQYQDEMSFEIEAPGVNYRYSIPNISGSSSTRLGNNKILVYYGEPSPYSPFQEVYIEIIPATDDNPYISEGIWKINVNAGNIISGRLDMWLPSAVSLNYSTSFVRPSPEVTLTIPSTAATCISVGGYNSFTNAYADFSGRGFTRLTNEVRPDISAPAVNIISAAPGGGTTAKSGTSMATPFVSGSAALLMEWGIVRGNDPYLYGEKVKAYFIKGARQLSGLERPNPRTGDCVKLVLG